MATACAPAARRVPVGGAVVLDRVGRRCRLPAARAGVHLEVAVGQRGPGRLSDRAGRRGARRAGSRSGCRRRSPRWSASPTCAAVTVTAPEHAPRRRRPGWRPTRSDVDGRELVQALGAQHLGEVRRVRVRRLLVTTAIGPPGPWSGGGGGGAAVVKDQRDRGHRVAGRVPGAADGRRVGRRVRQRGATGSSVAVWRAGVVGDGAPATAPDGAGQRRC